ncbi:hypothetical protein PPACK8108_LOCUS21892 [Phakopsora pachyrhizi]|uniref:Uncharacterized protein n=1 Tax=Phakopsora pachyrhizi TaxID=170000 RepID=A0AAV0BIV8_PHAPC|nr:hypothetical protein PPACK8108_LOCUS21892 [Phakopsora pachyrhizi]
MRGPPASSSPTTRSDTLLPTTDINRNRMKVRISNKRNHSSILSNPFDDSDFELDEMENLKLKKGALDKFRLPIDVIEGSVGSLLLSLIIRFYHYSRWPALGATLDDIYLLSVPASKSKFDLKEDEKRKQASKMEIRRSNGEAWLQVPRQRSANPLIKPDTRPRINYKEWFLIPLVSQLDREIFECEALPRIWLLHPDNSISHEDSNGLNLLMIEGLTKEERTQAKGLVRIGGFDPTYPTKKRRNSWTIDQELKLPKNESSSSGLDDQQTENATEETTLIPQIKKGKEREKDQRINEELEQRNQS